MLTKKIFTIAAVAILSVCMYGATAAAAETITDHDLYGPITTESGSEVVRDLGATHTAPAGGAVTRDQAIEFARPQLHDQSSDVWDTPDPLVPNSTGRTQALESSQVLHDWNSEDIVR